MIVESPVIVTENEHGILPRGACHQGIHVAGHLGCAFLYVRPRVFVGGRLRLNVGDLRQSAVLQVEEVLVDGGDVVFVQAVERLEISEIAALVLVDLPSDNRRPPPSQAT